MKPQTMSSQIPRHINQHFGDLCLTSGSNTTGCSQGGILLPNGTQAARRPEAEEALSANSRVRDQVPARLASPSRPSARASRNTNTTSQKASAASDHPFEHSFGNRLYGPGRVPASEIVDGVRTVTGEPRPGDAKLLGRKLLNGTYISEDAYQASLAARQNGDSTMGTEQGNRRVIIRTATSERKWYVNGEPHFPELVGGRKPFQWVDNQPFTEGTVVGSEYQAGRYRYDKDNSTAIHLDALPPIDVPASRDEQV